MNLDLPRVAPSSKLAGIPVIIRTLQDAHNQNNNRFNKILNKKEYPKNPDEVVIVADSVEDFYYETTLGKLWKYLHENSGRSYYEKFLNKEKKKDRTKSRNNKIIKIAAIGGAGLMATKLGSSYLKGRGSKSRSRS